MIFYILYGDWLVEQISKGSSFDKSGSERGNHVGQRSRCKDICKRRRHSHPGKCVDDCPWTLDLDWMAVRAP